MGFIGSALEKAEEQRFETDFSAITERKVELGSGINKSAYKSPRGYVVKSPGEKTCVLIDQEQTLQGIERLPENEIAFNEDRGEALVRMGEADMTHGEAVQNYGVSQVIEEDFEMFLDLAREGIIYKDLKPANIGYFHDEEEQAPSFEDVEARPIDLYDKNARDQRELSLPEFQSMTDVYIEGPFGESGLAGEQDLSFKQAEELVVDAIASNPAEINSNKYKGIDDATREFYRDNLR